MLQHQILKKKILLNVNECILSPTILGNKNTILLTT